MLQLEGTVYCISESNGNAPADDFCKEVQEQVREAKKDAETRRNFMEFEYKQMLIAKDAKEEGLEEGRKLGLEEGIEKGIEKGHKEERVSNYSSLVQDGILSLSEAMKRSGLSEQEINVWIQTHPNT